jgi:integrase
MSVHQSELRSPKRNARREKLTESVCRSIKVGERVNDADQAGFYAIGLARGRVSFWAKADIPAASRQWGLPARTMERVVGRWPDEISPKAARLLAATYVAQIKQGVDPKAKPGTTQATGWTLQKAFDEYMTKVERDGAGEGTLRTYRYAFARVPEKWLSRPIRGMITDGDGLRALHASILADLVARKGDRADEDTGKNSADDTIKTLARVSRYAKGKDDSLPIWNDHAVDLFGQRTREKEGMGLKEIGPWWEQVKTVRNPMRRELALFELLTGLRMTDARTALGEHLNEEKRTLFLPKPKGHNEKKRRNRAFTLPLSDAAMSCIHRAHLLKRKPSDLLFPNPTTGKPFSDTKLECGDNEFASGHRLRHTLTNIGAHLGIPDETIARLTNHKVQSQTGRYIDPDRVTQSPRQAMETISEAIMREIKL